MLYYIMSHVRSRDSSVVQKRFVFYIMLCYVMSHIKDGTFHAPIENEESFGGEIYHE